MSYKNILTANTDRNRDDNTEWGASSWDGTSSPHATSIYPPTIPPTSPQLIPGGGNGNGNNQQQSHGHSQSGSFNMYPPTPTNPGSATANGTGVMVGGVSNMSTAAYSNALPPKVDNIDAFLSQSPAAALASTLSDTLGDSFIGMGLEDRGNGGTVGPADWSGSNAQADEFVPHAGQNGTGGGGFDGNAYGSYGYQGGGGGGQGGYQEQQGGYQDPNGQYNDYAGQQVAGTVPVATQAPQGVFYMAVNVGGQQVLQPVQLVQLPNGQMATVLANQPGDGTGQQGAIDYGNQGMQAGMTAPMAGGVFEGYGRKGKGKKDSKDVRDLKNSLSSMDNMPVSTPADLAVDNQSGDIHALYGSTRRPALKDLLGNVRRLSKDQVGCRLLQQALDEDGVEAATAIFKEGLSFMSEIMIDPFGNYLFQKILEKCSDQERLTIIRTVAPKLVSSALNLHGTRSVQKVVEMCSFDSAAATCVTKALAPQAARLCIDANGNHVIQRVLQRLPHAHARFVFDAVAAAVGEVARHRHGCCVIQRCLDSPKSQARSNLVSNIVSKALELMQDAYGNYVVQYVLDVCSEEEASAVCQSVAGRVSMLAIQKFSSNVMEKCLEKANDKTQELYLRELSHPDKIKDLMSDPFGNYVVQRGLAVATHAQAVRLVEAMRPHLAGMRNTAGGRRIVAKICRRFPNFNSELATGGGGAHHDNPMMQPPLEGQIAGGGNEVERGGHGDENNEFSEEGGDGGGGGGA